MFEDQSFDVIMDRLLSAVPNTYDKREGSFIWDALSPAALELVQAYAELDSILKLGFALTTYGEYLDMKAAEHGVYRKSATKAVGNVVVSGTNGVLIPKGSLFATMTNIQFQSTQDATIGVTGQAYVPIEAIEGGKLGNVKADEITVIPTSIPGVNSVINVEPTAGGTDREDDEAFLKRFLERVRQPSTSGNRNHYIQWAKEVPGVGDAKVFPLWNGPGTVKVAIVDSEKRPASPTLVSTVAAHIEEVRPIGASVTVVSTIGKPINATATVTLATGYTLQMVQDAFAQQLEAYLRETAFELTYVSYAKIGTLLLGTPGVLDYTNLIVNGGTSNVALQDEEVPVLGSVSLGV